MAELVDRTSTNFDSSSKTLDFLDPNPCYPAFNFSLFSLRLERHLKYHEMIAYPVSNVSISTNHPPFIIGSTSLLPRPTISHPAYSSCFSANRPTLSFGLSSHGLVL